MPPKNKRQYMVIKRKENPHLTAIHGKKFGTHNAFVISDPKEAHDIDQRYGHAAPRRTAEAESVAVIPIADRRAQRQDGYKVQFSVPALPWHEKEDDDAEKENQPPRRAKRAQRAKHR